MREREIDRQSETERERETEKERERDVNICGGNKSNMNPRS